MTMKLWGSYPITEDNYPKVVQALKDRFGDKNLLIEHYIRRLLKLVVSNARKENLPLDEIYDDLTAHLKNLESLGVNTEMAGVFLYPLVESSLPLDIIQVWQRNPAVGYGIKEEGAENGDKSDASGRLQALMDFLRDEVKGAERMSFAKENFEGNSSMRATGSQLKTPRKTPPTVSNLFGSAFKRKCIFCQRDNHLTSAGPSCPACGSPDGSLDHRYWSCPHIRPLAQEAFNIVGRPPDLQAWIFGTDLKDDELAILASAKSRISLRPGWTGNPAMAAALLKIDMDPEQQLYTPKIENIAVPDVDPAGPRAYHKCAVVGYDIYVIGGFDGVVYFSGCRCFNAVTKTWREVAPMNSRRCYVSVTVLNKCVYAMGGFDGVHRQNTAERYDHTANQWTYIAPMNMQRSDASAATLEDCIYITGGFNGSECLSSAEYYHAQVNQWTMIAPMISRRSGVSCISYHGSIFVLGGFNGMSRLCSGEKYNPRTNTWTSIPDMMSRRSNFAIEVLI
ncbi:hypothetical protein LAZ67_16002783 [Cordylochernes scorpioides]|uniref:Uncharacterized protein n=1 Tax=Cordylochernes scorpioides TaxID=51811 RepID=A0ABY6LD61_9ARAC|nr:hypothetical protein LAZ67_16002783 [Cordylochernes scorpioides]